MSFRANKGITSDVEVWAIVESVMQLLGYAEECNPQTMHFDLSPFVQLTPVGAIVSTSKGTIFRDVIAAYNSQIPSGSKYGKLAGVWFSPHQEWRFARKDFFLVNLIAVSCFKEKETIKFPKRTVETIGRISQETQKDLEEGANEAEIYAAEQRKKEDEFKKMLQRRREMIKRHRES